MKIIPFPSKKRVKVSKAKLQSERPQIEQPLHLGPIIFTCPTCKTESKFSGLNIIFRALEFYCSNCGTAHRVTNPAFNPRNKG